MTSPERFEDIILIECRICHFDVSKDESTEGICDDCIEDFRKQDRLNTEFERSHWNGYEWDDE